MISKVLKLMSFLCLCATLSQIAPFTIHAAEVAVETSTAIYVKIDAPNVVVRETSAFSGKAVDRATQGQTYEVIGSVKNDWAKINTGSTTGYISTSGTVTLFEKTKEKVDESIKLRQDVVNYALQFVGNRYVYGGNDPHTGVDCSGFTKYVMRHVAGINLNRTSSSQASQGRTVKMSQAKAGDLVFYGGKNYINHVAIYMGNGKIVHASSAKTGIKISAWDHRTPVKIVSVLN